MTGWDSELEARLRRLYGAREYNARSVCSSSPKATPTADGFLTEVAGKLILTAPAKTVSVAEELPADMRERWEKASTANPYFLWLQGRFVEAEKANRNGAYWSTADLQFGEMTVRHGPLNWLHDARKVVGTIADNQLIRPAAQPTTVTWNTAPANAASLKVSSGQAVINAAATNTTALYANPVVEAAATPRPYIAAVSAMWRWIYPDEVRAVQAAAESGQLFYSMECVAREMSCVSDGELSGCGKSFSYLKAMTDPDSVCECMRSRSSARRMVDPAFLGGAVIIPPTQPGWGDARAEVMRQASALAEQVAPTDANASVWERLMAQVLAYAGSTA